jgi:hypothetical protein
MYPVYQTGDMNIGATDDCYFNQRWALRGLWYIRSQSQIYPANQNWRHKPFKPTDDFLIYQRWALKGAQAKFTQQIKIGDIRTGAN